MNEVHIKKGPPPKSTELPRSRRLIMQSSERNDVLSTPASNHHLEAVDHLITGDEQDQKEPATNFHKTSKGSSYAFSVRAKYGLPVDQNGMSVHNVHEHDNYMEHSKDDGEITLPHHDQKKGSNCRLPLRAKYNYLVDEYQHDRHVEHDLDINDPVSHHEVSSIEHHRKRGGPRIGVSTLQAARAQAAELRALHSAVLNSQYISPGSDSHKGIASHSLMPIDGHLMHYKYRANKKKSNSYNIIGDGKEKEDVQGALSSASSASSTADCFIRPVNEYPVFMPHSQEDILLNTTVDDVNFMNRRSSVDTFEAAMREERLHYIFDHENKRSFSGSKHFDDHSARDNSVSCLHESLNLPPRSAASLIHLRNNDDHQLHHMSLNLPQGSQHCLFKSSMQNPLFDQNTMHINKKSSHHHDDGSPSVRRIRDDLQSRPVNGNNADKYIQAHDEGKATTMQDFTSRQRALFEFLSEEPARMRAFNELAAKEAPPNYDVHPSVGGAPKQKSIQEDIAQPTSTKLTSKFESSRNIDQLQGSTDNHHHHHHPHNSFEHPKASIPQMRQRLVHALNNGHLHHTSTSVSGVSCDKCRPASIIPTVVVPLTDSREFDASNPPANVAVGAVIKDRPDQKKPSIKGWFFRGKKKHNNADHTNNPIIPAASNDRTPVTSGTFSTSKEQQMSSGSCTTSGTAPTSHVFSGLANSEAEKELEVAMAMDLMELKVLQANTKRDAAMAEVLELRLAMDSMAKKLAEVERYCESLKTQLLDVQELQSKWQEETHQLEVVNPNGAHPHSRVVENVDHDLWMHRQAAEDGDEGAAATDLQISGGNGVMTDGEDDFCESDSHDNREERRAAARIIGRGEKMHSSGYGGGVRRSRGLTQGGGVQQQPKREEFVSAVAEARVGVKQVSRVLLQHIQESVQGRSMCVETEEAGRSGDVKWGPLLMMWREARGGISNSSRGVGYCIEALIGLAFYEHFENVGFDKSGAHKILDPAQRALAFYHSFLKLAKLTPTQLLTQPSPLYNPAFDRFCSRKMRALGRAVGCPGRHWPDELARSFLSAARAVWLLHHLAFAYPSCPPGIFRVAAHSPFDPRFMELLPTDNRHVLSSAHLLVSLMVIPGFFLSDDVIKCKVLV